MRNTRTLTLKNTYIAEEWHKYGHILDNTEHTRSLKPIRRKKKSDVTRAREAQERRYTSRSNICPIHNMTRAVGTGECPMGD